jgi:baseplate J-like protein
MSCTGTASCSCGCCAGTSVQTPQRERNRAGLSALAYRVGAWASFKESMLARLSSSDYPALMALKTRADDDFTVALLDATSIVLDILTFYQERLVNESYLRTATQVRSLTELSRLIGYQPAPGVAASTYLAFTLKQATGHPPDPAALPITIPKGTQAQSVPAQGQQPQIFETSADIQAKPDWNALPVRTGSPWAPATGDRSLYLAGTATQLQPGDLFLIVGDERAGSSASENWDVRVVAMVTVDGPNNRTFVTWNEGLGGGSIAPASQNPKFYAFRQRAALFGYNALQTILIDQTHLTSIAALLNSDKSDWDFTNSQSSANKELYKSQLIDLDGVYSKIVPHGWIALIVPDAQTTRSPAGLVTLYRVISVTTISRSDFGIGSKLSRIAADLGGTNLQNSYIATRATSALVQSEQLAVPEQPLHYPLYGTFLELEGLRPDLAAVTAVALTGKSQKVAVTDGVTKLSFLPGGDATKATPLNPGDVLTLIDPMPLPLNADGSITVAEWAPGGGAWTLYVEDASGRPGTVIAPLSDFDLLLAGSKDPVVTEYALVASVNTVSIPYPHTCIQLQGNLTNCYDRTATNVNANVGLATDGQSVIEMMGNGNASVVDQKFTLRQSPLTYVQAPTPTGMQSTLQVRVNGVAWSEVATLYQQPTTEQVFATLNESNGTTDVQFGGDGEGSVLPTGQNNLIANYRIGSGVAGNVAAGSITTLMDRPLGVSGVTNPQNATGGQDPQSIDDIRLNAPQTVLTLGRAVSTVDYQNYAATFAGIAKAYAIWIPSGRGRGVFITVAGVGGAALSSSNPTLTNLATSLQNYGNPLVPISIASYVETLFKFTANVQYDPAFDLPTVQANVSQTLTQAFSFAARSFGQAVSIDEIAATIQGVSGVLAVNVTGLQRTFSSTGGDLASLDGFSTITELNQWLSQSITLSRPFADSPDRLCAYLPVAGVKSSPQPAEILVIDPRPGPVILGVMS